MLRSGMCDSLLLRCECRVNASRCALSMRHGIHHFASAVYAIASSEVLGIRCLHRLGIHNDLASIQCEFGNVLQEGKLLLSERLYYHIDIEREFTSWYGTE